MMQYTAPITKIDEKETAMPSLVRHRAQGRLSLIGMYKAFLAREAMRSSRGRLAVLDDHLLRDIGLSREAALEEAARKDWDAPEHWYR
jgi:uncharacterized protein YjiS (DUF1127 family)